MIKPLNYLDCTDKIVILYIRGSGMRGKATNIKKLCVFMLKKYSNTRVSKCELYNESIWRYKIC